MSVKPLPQALWLVDDVEEDGESGKITLAGICEILDIVEPATDYTEGAFLYFALRNVHGNTHVVLDYLDVADDRNLLTIKITVSAESPHETVARAFCVNRIPVPHDGNYAWQLRWNDELIAEAPIVAYIKPSRGKKD